MSKAREVLKEDILTAVLIADSFSIRFSPITNEKPKALLPLVNKVMIDYALEWLTNNKVDKVYIYCVHCASQIRAYIQQSLWMRENSSMAIEVLSQGADDCRSLGDSLRDIDGKSLIRSDFILLSAAVVSNVNIKPILETHKERRKMDKGLIMTHLFRKCYPGHRSRSSEEELVLVVNPDTQRILNYQCSSHLKKIPFPLDVFQANKKAQIRYDFVDCHISICSPDVLPLFTDNFDYQTKNDFVCGILNNTDILGNSICYHLLQGEYAAQVSNIFLYDAISKDIMERWSHPLVPDIEWGGQVLSRHVSSRHNVYMQPNVTLAKGSVLENTVAVGKGTSIGERSLIKQSVIGNSCSIGNDTRISNAYIWDNVVVKDKCIISVALIAEDVTLNEGVVLGSGCVIGPGVILGAGTVVPPNTRLMATPPKPNDDDFGSSDDEKDDTPIKPDYPDSQAYIHRVNSEDSDVESLADELWGLAVDDQEDEEDGSDSENPSDNEDEEPDVVEEDMLEDERNILMFKAEIYDSMKRAYKDKVDCENLVSEINGSKFAYNISMDDINGLVMKQILSFPSILSKGATAFDKRSYWTALKPVLEYFVPLLQKYGKSNVSKRIYLQTLDEYGVSNPCCGQIVGQILSTLYQKDVIPEDNIQKWFEIPPNDPLAMDSVRKYAQVFINWLDETDSEDEDDE